MVCAGAAWASIIGLFSVLPDTLKHAAVGYTINWCATAIILEKIVSGFLAVAVKKAYSNSRAMGNSEVRLPVLPVRVYLLKGSKLVYDLIDSGSEETLVSKSLYQELKLCGIPLEVLLITVNGSCNLYQPLTPVLKLDQ